MGYEILQDSEDSTHGQQHEFEKICRLRMWSTILFTSLGLLLILGVLNLVCAIETGLALKSNTEKHARWKSCGSSALEARDRGCVFDIMMTGWVKEECYHEDLSEEYIRDGDFRFYSDIEGTQEIPLSVMRKGEHNHMFTNDLHHRAHCVYVWKLQALALESQAAGKVQLISNESMSYDHTVHCAGILVNSNPAPPYPMNRGEVDFLTCGPYFS